jgi:hypothetical protein
MYRCLNEAEHGWNYNHQQLNLAREEVNTRTHMIIHLENAIEQEDLEFEERAATIATLEQQLQVHQLQAPPTPTAPADPDTVSNVDEE